ncbi:DUF948 domain-containing protein [Paenibacillus rhizoplanae]
MILTLRKGMTTLGETNRTLGEVRNAIHGLTGEATQLIHTANQVTRDVKGKIKNDRSDLRICAQCGRGHSDCDRDLQEERCRHRPELEPRAGEGCGQKVKAARSALIRSFSDLCVIDKKRQFKAPRAGVFF